MVASVLGEGSLFDRTREEVREVVVSTYGTIFLPYLPQMPYFLHSWQPGTGAERKPSRSSTLPRKSTEVMQDMI